ncbi:CYTH domain-containing protein [Priestia koreensis]|uniref:CYTH domain-containing protein n=1 Tax=Priestia koreensis TaxID=284581 RepID=UPI0020418302|nr:CYTH domain-containing protein [Priestia koreensis]MCM3004879.1 CYTH domain-containing protein [Priestia koreensis]
MNQELEIEFKNMLTKGEFVRLTKQFTLTENDFKLQENHYFDTADFQLKNHGAALRIRQKKGTYTLTLKQPVKDGLLETHEPLSKEQAENILENPLHIFGQIVTILADMNISTSSLLHFGTLATNRAEFSYKSGLLVLDHSFYLEKEDYELEYEATDFTEGQKEFKDLLHSLTIPARTTENKIRRFYKEKYKQISEE